MSILDNDTILIEVKDILSFLNAQTIELTLYLATSL